MEGKEKEKQKKLPYRFTCEIPIRVIGKAEVTEEEKSWGFWKRDGEEVR